MALTRSEKSWILYDVANSAFVLIVTTTLMPIFFKAHDVYCLKIFAINILVYTILLHYKDLTS